MLKETHKRRAHKSMIHTFQRNTTSFNELFKVCDNQDCTSTRWQENSNRNPKLLSNFDTKTSFTHQQLYMLR
ncbi:hypothetical protein Leryth_023406 [Lithospermum erythrorhizon]|nr:hypothetical protein Leryth_023406 [Lithospermum erythrorhizon]